MTERISWPDKYTGEKFISGINWVDRQGDATITAWEFTVLEGDVTLSNAVQDGDNITKVTVEGGTPGICEVLCSVTLSSGGDPLEEIAQFRIKGYT